MDVTLIILGISGVEKRPKKKVRHAFGDLESQKQVNFGYGMKNRRTGAAAITNPPHPPKEKNGKQSEKNTKRGKIEGLNPLSWSPTAAVTSTLFKHPLAYSPTRKRTKKTTTKSNIKNTKTAKRGLEPAHLTSYCCEEYIFYSTAVCTAVHVMLLSKGTLLPLLLQYVQKRTILKSYKSPNH